jgi:hypothetical protein
MGSYVYKVTAKRVKMIEPVTLSDGRVMTEANMGKYAYKPFNGWSEEDEKANRRMEKKAAIHVAERFVKGENYTGLVCADGMLVYEWPYGTYNDDWMADKGKVVGLVKPEYNPEYSDEVNAEQMKHFEEELKKLRERQAAE